MTRMGIIAAAVLMAGCKVDIHFDTETPNRVQVEAPIAPKPQWERTTSYLNTKEAMERALAHGWEVERPEATENGVLYHLKRRTSPGDPQ